MRITPRVCTSVLSLFIASLQTHARICRETSLQKRVDKVKDIITKLHDLEDSQMESTLLRSCLALPKVAFSLRSCPPSHIQHATAAFDETMLEALSDIAGSPPI